MSLVLVTIPFALADETKADCEPNVTYNNKPQPWIAYAQTDALRELWYGAVDPNHQLNLCEGEHWDGQDNVQSGENPGVGTGCTPTTGDLTTESIFIGSCMNSDPNQGGADPTVNGQVLSFRVSFRSTGNSQQLYVAANIALVGRAVLYEGQCQGGSGLEGDSTCDSGHQGRTATYLRDDTPGNLLATVISSLGITKGHVSEQDCDQATYEKGAYDGTRGCGRDNTAITVETLLA
jgi:hypothetical protein